MAVSLVRPVQHGEKTRRFATLSAAAVMALVAFAALAWSGSGSGKAALSVTFEDGPDPDAPARTDLWNNGLSGMSEMRRPAAPPQPAMDSYRYSQGGYEVKRLQRVMSKIQDAETDFSKVDREREELVGQIDALTRRAAGLSLQAKDIKEDLTRYSEQQRELVAELHPKEAAEEAEVGKAEKEAEEKVEEEAKEEEAGVGKEPEGAVGEEGSAEEPAAEGEEPAAEEPAAEGEKPAAEEPAAEGAGAGSASGSAAVEGAGEGSAAGSGSAGAR